MTEFPCHCKGVCCIVVVVGGTGVLIRADGADGVVFSVGAWFSLSVCTFIVPEPFGRDIGTLPVFE